MSLISLALARCQLTKAGSTPALPSFSKFHNSCPPQMSAHKHTENTSLIVSGKCFQRHILDFS
jgi:hypothetical protein